MNPEQETELKTRIQEVCPELMEWRPGIKFLWCGEEVTFVGCDDMKTYVSKDLLDGTFEVFSVGYSKGEDKIIGHSIQLAHVLRALEESEDVGSILDSPDGANSYCEKLLIMWNILTDYEGQSDATKEFLYNLICRK